MPQGEDSAEGGPLVEGRVVFAIAGEEVALDLAVPEGDVSADAVLPALQQVAEAIVGRAERRVNGAGEAISCRAGCGACCRQPVPVAEPEARALARVVAAMEPERRERVRARFADARRRLEEAGLAEAFARIDRADTTERRRAGLAYFALGLACPLLEDESCSIHPDRPLACREYLVTSPAAACAEPDPAKVRTVPLPAKPSSALFGLTRAETPGGWLLLIDALEFAERHPDRGRARTGPSWLEAALRRLCGATEE